MNIINTPDFIKSKLSAEIPDYVIQERQAGGNQTLSYISGATVIDILNSTFGHLGWDFTILNQWKEQSEPFFQKQTKWFNPPADKLTTNDKGEKGAWSEQAPVAWVHGRLTVRLLDDNNQPYTVVKEAFGSKSIIGKQSEQEHIFKSAQTDALKKAASLLGIGAQLYRNEEEQLYQGIISKPVIWTKTKIESSEIWEKLMTLVDTYSWNITDLNGYVSEVTDGSYVDIYTLPEKYVAEIIDNLEVE